MTLTRKTIHHQQYKNNNNKNKQSVGFYIYSSYVGECVFEKTIFNALKKHFCLSLIYHTVAFQLKSFINCFDFNLRIGQKLNRIFEPKSISCAFCT